MLLGRFGLQLGNNNQLLWVLTKEELQLAQQRLKHLVIPAHLDFNPQHLFTHPSRLKSHDWKQVNHDYMLYIYIFYMLVDSISMTTHLRSYYACFINKSIYLQVVSQGVLKYCLKNMLGIKQRDSLFCFLKALESVLSKSHKADEILLLKNNLNMALALLERDFPIAIQVCS